jgi:hypothetical protein
MMDSLRRAITSSASEEVIVEEGCYNYSNSAGTSSVLDLESHLAHDYFVRRCCEEILSTTVGRRARSEKSKV